MDPKRLTRFLDQDYLRHTAPGGLGRTTLNAPPAQYLESLSIKFATFKGEPFERLRPSKVVVKPDDTTAPPGGVLGVAATETSKLPSPRDSLLLRSGLAASAPRLPAEKFYLGHTVQPKPRAEPLPDEPDVDLSRMYEPEEGLTLPSVRRKRNIVQSQRINAEKVKRKTQAEQIRMLHLMKARHPAGVVGVDSPLVATSPVYAGKHRAHVTTVARKAEAAARRRQALLEKSSGAAMRGYNPIAPDVEAEAFVPPAAGTVRPRADAAVSGVKFMNSKGRAGPQEDTYSRIFQAPELKAQNPIRLEYIRNNSTNGKEYNPVTGAKIEHIKPTIAEKRNARQAHPSILSSSSPFR